MTTTLLESMYPSTQDTEVLDGQAIGMTTGFLGTFDIPKTSIKLDDWKLRELWCKGIIPDLAYISFALELESKANFNINSFVRKWENVELSEQQLDDGWKPKKLKLRTVLNTICVLDEKGVLGCDFQVSVNQLSLFE